MRTYARVGTVTGAPPASYFTMRVSRSTVSPLYRPPLLIDPRALNGERWCLSGTPRKIDPRTLPSDSGNPLSAGRQARLLEPVGAERKKRPPGFGGDRQGARTWRPRRHVARVSRRPGRARSGSRLRVLAWAMTAVSPCRRAVLVLSEVVPAISLLAVVMIAPRASAELTRSPSRAPSPGAGSNTYRESPDGSRRR
jgi:hypothetical protein